MCQTVSIVSGNGLLPFQHQAISSVPEPCWLKINWTLRNNPVKFISPCYLIHLYITVHKIWIELNWNWKKINWIGIELKDSESDLNWNWIELKNSESNLNWNWIELKEMNWSEPWSLLCTFPAWLKFHFVVFHFLVIRTNFAHALTVYRYSGRWVSCHTSPNRPISKKLGLKTILLISFRST